MGLFSKKTVVCSVCGKEYQVRIKVGEAICNDCLDKRIQKEKDLKGYIDYAQLIENPLYSDAEMDQIIAHRKAILEKNKQLQKISSQELATIGDNYKNLSDEQAQDFLQRAYPSVIFERMGSSYSDTMLVLNSFENVVVDMEDVFAVSMSESMDSKADGHEVILCTFYTNDPYIPIVPMAFISKLGFFESSTSKKGREFIKNKFEAVCPNLKYPVQDIFDLKKTIEEEGTIRGNIEFENMKKYILLAIGSLKVCSTMDMKETIDIKTLQFLNEYDCITESFFKLCLKVDKMFQGRYWRKQIDIFNTK